MNLFMIMMTVAFYYVTYGVRAVLSCVHNRQKPNQECAVNLSGMCI